MDNPNGKTLKGRGASQNPRHRFTTEDRECFDDGWPLDDDPAQLRTEVVPDRARTVIASNDSPDIPFDASLNPYRGCEHGCAYCYARPTHEYLGLSAGLDFETKLFAKFDAPALLERELRAPGYRCRPIMLGGNTDAYQPVEREFRITRRVVEVLAAFNHPIVIVTKAALVARDLDLLGPLAAKRLAQVFLSVTTLRPGLARRLEPRAAAPHRRLETITRLSSAGVPVGVLAAPMIPGLNDHELETILEAARDAGATSAGWTLLRLPYGVKELMTAWLETHAPERRDRVLSLVRQSRGGRLNDPSFGSRFTGTGPYAELLARRFGLACRRLGLAHRAWRLETSLFAPPPRTGDQLRLL